MTLRKVNLITMQAKIPMERREWRKFQFDRCGRKTPRELFQGKPTQSSKGRENPTHTMPPGGIWIRVPEAEGKAGYYSLIAYGI